VRLEFRCGGGGREGEGNYEAIRRGAGGGSVEVKREERWSIGEEKGKGVVWGEGVSRDEV